MTSTVQLAAGSYDNITTGNENKLHGEVSYIFVHKCVWECDKAHMQVFVCVCMKFILIYSINC